MSKYYDDLSQTSRWLRDHLHRVLGWGIGLFVLVGGWGLSAGRQIGFWANDLKVPRSELALPDEFAAAVLLLVLSLGAMVVWGRLALDIHHRLRDSVKRDLGEKGEHVTVPSRRRLIALIVVVGAVVLILDIVIVSL